MRKDALGRKVGARKNNAGVKGIAGRKKIDDAQRKKPVAIQLEQYKIDALGGLPEARIIMISALEKAYSDKLQK